MRTADYEEGVLEFDYEEVEECIADLRNQIIELEEDIEEAENAKADLEGVASGYAINAYGEYSVEIADYKDSIEFYEAIADDLQDFLDDVDGQAKFVRNPNFYYNDSIKEEIDNLRDETRELRNKSGICIVDWEHTPFGPFQRGNYFHKGSSEEQLIDHNDGRMEQWAEEVNNKLTELVDLAEEIERLHTLHFSDITLDDWKKEHDWHDGITEHSRVAHNVSYVGTALMNVGVVAKSAYNSKQLKNAKPKKTKEVTQQEINDYVDGLVTEGKQQPKILTEDEVFEKIDLMSQNKEPIKEVNLDELGNMGSGLSEKQIEDLVDMSTYNTKSESVTLGKYYEDNKSYLLDALENDSTYFNTGPEIWEALQKAGLSDSEIWKINKKFLDKEIEKNKLLRFSHNPNNYIDSRSFFGREIRYIMSRDYNFVEIGGYWYAAK